MLSKINADDVAAAQALAQGVTDMVVLLLCSVKAWLETLNTVGDQGSEQVGEQGTSEWGLLSGWWLGAGAQCFVLIGSSWACMSLRVQAMFAD